MRYKELKIKFLGFTGAPDPTLTVVGSVKDGDDTNFGSHKFFFVNNRQNAFEITIENDPSDQNQRIKEAFDLDLLPLGKYETDIDNDFVYLYINNPIDEFYFVVHSGITVNKSIDNNYSPDVELAILEGPERYDLLNAYNDNVVYIEAGDTNKLELTFNDKLPLTLYPSPEGYYYLNLKDPAKALINQNHFKDEIVPDIENKGYIYPDPSIYLSMKIDIKAYLAEDLTFNQIIRYEFIKAVEQIANFKDTIFNKFDDLGYLMLPQGKTKDHYKLTYYEGYPLDFSFYSLLGSQNEIKVQQIQTIQLKNLTTGHDVILIDSVNVKRLFLSQGSEDFTINDILPIQSGINRIEVTIKYNDKLNNKTLLLHLNKKEPKCAPYFKFYRNRGGWGYIRFEKEFAVTNKLKDGKDFKIDFEGIRNTLTRTLNTGKESTIEMDFQTEALEDWEMENFKDFVKSPRVEMYVNDLFQKQEKDSWIGVKVSSSSLDTKSLKTKSNRERVRVEFQEYTLSL